MRSGDAAIKVWIAEHAVVTGRVDLSTVHALETLLGSLLHLLPKSKILLDGVVSCRRWLLVLTPLLDLLLRGRIDVSLTFLWNSLLIG